MIEEEHFGYIGNKEISKYILKNKRHKKLNSTNVVLQLKWNKKTKFDK